MITVLTGNKAAANGVLLSRPDLIAMYPITPQTPLAEELAHFHADGRLDCEMVEVEGEHSAISVLMGACVAGGRVFTATSSWGLAYMNEPLMYCAGMRVPAVMVDVTRESPSLRGVSGGRQDIMSIRDSGWIQIEPETCQEILDSVIMAYRLAEDPEVLLPVVVAYDGYYLSHSSERVDIPGQDEVDKFLAPVTRGTRPNFKSEATLHFSPSIDGKPFAEYRYKTMQALERVKDKIVEVEREFQQHFGRSYGGMVDTYRDESPSCSGLPRQ